MGGVVTQTSFQVEVWNADEISHRGNSVGVTGSDGVTVGAGPTLPTFWPPFSSYFTTIVVSPCCTTTSTRPATPANSLFLGSVEPTPLTTRRSGRRRRAECPP